MLKIRTKRFIYLFLTLTAVICAALALSSCSAETCNHTYGDYEYDVNNHWQACGECGKKDVQSHTLVNGVCSVCGAVIEGSQNLECAGGCVYGIGNCTDTEIIIPSFYDGVPVTNIYSRAFEDCTSLTSVSLPDSVTTIGVNAFSGCTALNDIKIGDGVTSIGSGVISNTAYYNEQSNWENGALYINKYLFEADKSIADSFSVKDGTTVIAEEAFYGCKNLTSIAIPDSVTEIGASAFADCSSLKSISVPDGVKTISIHTFSGCDALAAITLSENLTGIGSYAFYGCQSLAGITIPESVTDISDYAFHGCGALADINVKSGNKTYKSKDGNLYSHDGTIFIQYAAGKTDNSFTIPEGVSVIGKNSFSWCASLKSVTVPKSVTKINENAFYLSSITSVIILNDSTLIDDDAFVYCNSLRSIYFNGTESKWENNNGKNNYSSDLTVYFYLEDDGTSTAEGNYWYYDEEGNIKTWNVE